MSVRATAMSGCTQPSAGLASCRGRKRLSGPSTWPGGRNGISLGKTQSKASQVVPREDRQARLEKEGQRKRGAAIPATSMQT